MQWLLSKAALDLLEKQLSTRLCLAQHRNGLCGETFF